MPSLFAIRQAESTPVPNSTAKPNDPNALFTVIAAVVGVAAVLVLLLAVARLYVVRRRRAALATGQNASLSPNPATATATVGVPDHFLFSGGSRTTQQPPMVVRMQRHIQANGLSVEELDKIAPVKLSRPDEMPDVRDASPGSTTSECVQDDCTCPVCLEEMSPDDKVRRMPCTHTFHAQYVFREHTYKLSIPLFLHCSLCSNLKPICTYNHPLLRKQMYRRMGNQSEPLSSL